MEKKKTTSRNWFAKPGTLSVIISLLFIAGCAGPEPWEMGLSGLGSIGIVIVVGSFPIIIGLTWLTTGRNLIELKRVWLQFIVFFVIILLFVFLLDRRSADYPMINFTLIALILSLPYLFFTTLLLLTVIPILNRILNRDFYPYLPTCVLAPHFVMSALLIATNSPFLMLFIIRGIYFSYITIPASIGILVWLIVAKRRRRSQPPASDRCQNPQCGIIFYRGTFPGDFPDRCPRCRHSATEQSLKKSSAEQER